jgi:predicted dehydrogenase
MIRYLFICFFIIGTISGSYTKEKPLKIAILGLGGQSQCILHECIKLNQHMRVVAVCDDHAHDSLDFFVNTMEAKGRPHRDLFLQAFETTTFYLDNEDAIKSLFENHPEIDLVFITSPNYHHLRHLNDVLAHSTCKSIYMEKPIFRTLDEFSTFTLDEDEAQIYIGLTLRYATMTRIVAHKLRAFQEQLGKLKHLKAWEHLKFCQGLTSFMMSWRKYYHLSGGFMLEKSIHDLDLALFFIHTLGINPESVSITTEAAHKLFRQSQREVIIQKALRDEEIKASLIDRDKSHFHRFTPFTWHRNGQINWPATINDIFKTLPHDDALDGSDIIFDYHKLNAIIESKSSEPVTFELEVEMCDFTPKTERGMHFTFENGSVYIDVMKSVMHIELDNGIHESFDLKTNNSDHADGDEYIAHAILGILPQDQYIAMFNDPIVQLATCIGLVSEQQAQGIIQHAVKIKKLNNKWGIC